MAGKKKKPNANSVARLAFVALSFLLQAGWILVRVQVLNEYSDIIATATGWLAVIVVLYINSKHTNSAMKMPWIMLILAMPMMGLTLYVLIVILGDPGISKRLKKVRQEMAEEVPDNARQAFCRLEGENRSLANQSRYLWQHMGYPVYENTAVTYYPQAKEAFEELKRELETAERFIFMEYFIVEDASAFREVEEILVRKAKAGVEVRLMYDDIGSAWVSNMRVAGRLNAEGIHCVPFNPALPVLNVFLNHRDHRKITVIDGRVGFTGGYNLAEEYFDRTHPYGHWKDTGLRLEGEAVRSLTAIFLELWCVQTKQKEDFSQYRDVFHSVPAKGYVQPFADNPLGEERVAENVYISLINRAQESLYVMTPYLIITDEMSHALTLAAKRGVDVRIITPGIPDKKTVYAVTRSYYASLARQGVRIYEYTPGFCHAKQCICDGNVVSLGTSNFDYRSLYHHFENNVLFFGGDAVEQVAADFTETFAQCREVTRDYAAGRGAMLRTWQYILRLFAPLL